MGKLIEGTVMVTESGTKLVANMAWETPYVKFLTPTNGEVAWVSNLVESAHLCKGDIVKIRAFLRERTGNLYRVTISR